MMRQCLHTRSMMPGAGEHRMSRCYVAENEGQIGSGEAVKAHAFEEQASFAA